MFTAVTLDKFGNICALMQDKFYLCLAVFMVILSMITDIGLVFVIIKYLIN